MRFSQKWTVCFLILVIGFVAIIFENQFNYIDKKSVASNIFVSAIYYNKTKEVQISYGDNTNMTNLVTLEIEGLTNSFQKNFTTSHFEENVTMPQTPQYGWKTIPVTFLVKHNEYGQILIKTEISPSGQPLANVIYERP